MDSEVTGSRENLLPGGSLRRWFGDWSKRKTIISLAVIGVLVAAVVSIVFIAGSTKSNAVIPTPAPPTAHPVTSPTTSATTTTTSSTTTTTTTPTTTAPPETTTSTTKAPETTTPTTKTPDTTTITTFIPTTKKPLPANATDKPPINLLIEMGMQPEFEEILCLRQTDPVFKYRVQVLGGMNFTGESSRKEGAKTESAINANEFLFKIVYPLDKHPPKPVHPCKTSP